MNYRKEIGLRAYSLKQQLGRNPTLQETLDYDPLLDSDIRFWEDLIDFLQSKQGG